MSSTLKLDPADCVAWNTGRWYSKNGQRIGATCLEDGRVAFVDVDRFIAGLTRQVPPGDAETPASRKRLQAFVMREYDRCAYDDLSSAMYLMNRGGELSALRARLTAAAEAVEPADMDPPPFG